MDHLKNLYSEKVHLNNPPAKEDEWGLGTVFVPCLAHVLHNCVMALLNAIKSAPSDKIDLFDQGFDLANKQKIFRSVKHAAGFSKTMAKICKIAKATNNSTQRHEYFLSCTLQTVGKALKLKIDVRARWHSTVAMLERAVLLKKAISDFLDEYPKLRSLAIEQHEWSMVELIIKVLEPFHQSALYLMDGTGIQIDHTLNAYDRLFEMLEKARRKLSRSRTGYGEGSKQQADQLISGIEAASKKLSKYYAKTDTGLVYFAARLLHPLRKDKLFLTPSWIREAEKPSYRDEYVNRVDEAYVKHYVRSPFPQTGDNSVVGLSWASYMSPNDNGSIVSTTMRLTGRSKRPYTMFDEDDEPDNTTEVMNKYYWQAFSDYIKDPTERKGELDVSDHALAFWRNESARQPHLALMARDILAVPATSVDVERLFSQARNLISYNRH